MLNDFRKFGEAGKEKKTIYWVNVGRILSVHSSGNNFPFSQNFRKKI